MVMCLKVQEYRDVPYGENMLLGNLCASITSSTIGLNSMLMKQKYIINVKHLLSKFMY